MKAQAFLQLVKELLTVQQNYFAWRRHSDLVKAKHLEKQAWAVIKQGRLEPDVTTTAEIKEPTQLDFVQVQRRNDDQPKPLTEVSNDNNEQPRNTNH